MPVLGWICITVAAVLVGFVVTVLQINHVQVKRQEKYYREHGEQMIGWIVQVNAILTQPGRMNAPAHILVAFDCRDDQPDPDIAWLAQRVGRLKGTHPMISPEREIVALVNKESYRPFDRHLLPHEFTGGREVYSMHIYIERSLLPPAGPDQSSHALKHPFVRCVLFRSDPKYKRAVMIAYEPSDDRFASGWYPS